MLESIHYCKVFDFQDQSCIWWPTAGILVLSLLGFAFGRSKRDSGQRIFIFSVAILFGLGGLFAFIQMYGDYAHVREVYRLGRYEVVEGTVEEFHPIPWQDPGWETFVVRGQKFEYRDGMWAPGFSTTASRGGPIREGLPVRVSYVQLEFGAPISNSIVKLEIKCQ